MENAIKNYVELKNLINTGEFDKFVDQDGLEELEHKGFADDADMKAMFANTWNSEYLNKIIKKYNYNRVLEILEDDELFEIIKNFGLSRLVLMMYFTPDEVKHFSKNQWKALSDINFKAIAEVKPEYNRNDYDRRDVRDAQKEAAKLMMFKAQPDNIAIYFNFIKWDLRICTDVRDGYGWYNSAKNGLNFLRVIDEQPEEMKLEIMVKKYGELTNSLKKPWDFYYFMAMQPTISRDTLIGEDRSRWGSSKRCETFDELFEIFVKHDFEHCAECVALKMRAKKRNTQPWEYFIEHLKRSYAENFVYNKYAEKIVDSKEFQFKYLNKFSALSSTAAYLENCMETNYDGTLTHDNPDQILFASYKIETNPDNPDEKYVSDHEYCGLELRLKKEFNPKTMKTEHNWRIVQERLKKNAMPSAETSALNKKLENTLNKENWRPVKVESAND